MYPSRLLPATHDCLAANLVPWLKGDFQAIIAPMITLQLAESVRDAVRRTFDLEVSDIEVVPSQDGFGDFSCNVAFGLAKTLGQSPRTIAARLAAAIDHPDVASLEAAGAGFINLTLKAGYWCELLQRLDGDFGRSDVGAGTKVQVEFISANPTGPLTLANARGGFLGDVIGNVLAYAGYDVTKEYYINDSGGQVGKLVESMQAEVGLAIEGERQYSGSYVADLVRQVDPTAYTDQSQLASDAVAVILTDIRRATLRLGVEFDEWTSEQELVNDGATARMLSWLDQRGLVYTKDSAVWLGSSAYGDERDRVLVRSTSQPTYLLNDLAYHFSLFTERKYDRAIKVWGADHAGQVASLKLTAEQFSPPARLEFVLIQFVRLMSEGKEVKMSKRAGTYVTIDELIDTLENSVGPEYGAAVARWFFLMRSSDNRMDFDLALASDQSQKNPLFYCMYAYVRAHSIIKKARDGGLEAATTAPVELAPLEIKLAKGMAQLPTVLELVATDYGVHRLTFYAQDLAKTFQEYYESERIIGLDAEVAASKLFVVARYIVFMDIVWKIIGITPQTRMQQPERT